MIVLFSDFGGAGPYTGQMEAAIHNVAPDQTIIRLFDDAPAFNPKASAYLLAAYTMVPAFAEESVFLCVVDPGVGGLRDGLILRAANQWYVGPDNGLFEVVLRHAENPQAWRIDWQPETLSTTFHGRDIFAPVAARLACGATPEEAGKGEPLDIDSIRHVDWPDDLAEIIYIDHYGNLITGLRAQSVGIDDKICIDGANNHIFSMANTFGDVPLGKPFWYQNANGLLELALNSANASDGLRISIGTKILF